MDVLPTCMAMHHLHATVVFPRTEATDRCKLHAGAGNRTWVLWKSIPCCQLLAHLWGPQSELHNLNSGSDRCSAGEGTCCLSLAP